MAEDGGTRLGPGAEFDIVRRLQARWGASARGLGDDAAIIDVPPGSRLVASTDTSVDGVHFRTDWLSWAEIGYRASTAAVSDLAAMAAVPLGMLVAATLPSDGGDWIDDLAGGIGEAAQRWACPIVGGDLTRGDRVSLTITVLGAVERPVRRDGARPGDALYVTGRLGGPAAALDALAAGRAPAPDHRHRFAHPDARIAEARWLASRGATAMIDLSDGLSSDALHLAAASGVTLRIDLEALCTVDGVEAARAAAGGEEYELLVAAPDELSSAAFEAEHGIPLSRIGLVREGGPAVEFLRRGERVDLPRGYDHFSP